MAKAKEERKKEILQAIYDHLMIEGPRGWDTLAQSVASEISRPTFFRYVKEVREAEERKAATHGNGALIEAQKRIRASVESPDITTKKIKAHLPSAPSPAIVAAAPQDMISSFNFFAFFDRIVSDAELVRGASISVNADGSERVKNPGLLDKNLQRRLQILETYMHSVEVVYNMDRIRELYDLIIEEIGKAAPDVQQAVLFRMRELDNRRGLTINAKVA